jgi:NADPH2:quinone reductase
MRSIRVHKTGPPEVMALEETELPKPGPGQLLVRLKAAGVNPVDTYVRAGTFGYSPELPYTPGADGAGVVESVGPGVTKVRPGDRVYGSRCVTGSYAEAGLFEESHLFPLPGNVTFAQGACLAIPYGTAYRALFQKGRARAGETVLIHGASGGVGLAAVQLGRAAGLNVIGTAGSAEGRKLLLEQGALEARDHNDLGKIRPDLILEMLANENLGRDLKIAAPFGRIVVIGSRGPVEVDARDAMQNDVTVLGMVLKNTPPEEFRKIHEGLAAGLKKGELRPVIGKEFPLAQAAQAHRAVMTSPALGKIVLVMEER